MALLDIFKRKKYSREEKQKERYRQKAREEERRPKTAMEQKQDSKKIATGKKAGESEYASRILRAPLVTEKSTRLSEHGTYTFRVADRATKQEVKKAVEGLYGVHTEKVRILNTPSKPRMHRGRAGRKPGYRKAIVVLQKGERIEFM